MDFGARLMPSSADAKKFADALAKSVSKINVDKKYGQDLKEDDLNMLPLPTCQEIAPEQHIRWTWHVPCRGGGARVAVTLFVSTNLDLEIKSGDFMIEVFLPVLVLTPVEAKAFGHAVISASQWQNVWKQHIGTFIERDIYREV
jgi:hypothetical protein